MNNDQNTGVTEARFALTLVICILVAVGYAVLLRLSRTPNQSVIEDHPEVVVQPAVPVEDPHLPRVLPLEPSNSSASSPQELANRPSRNSDTGSSPH